MEEGLQHKRFPRERININGTDVESVDIKPDKQKNEVPVFVAQGWGATMQSFEPGFEVLSKEGRRVVSADHQRKGGKSEVDLQEDMEKWCQETGQEYPDWPTEELRKAQTILGLLDQKKLDKVDVIAHSEGAINVCIAAMLNPEKFIGRTIVLVNPAGMIGEDTLLRLQKGAGATKSRTESVKGFPVTDAETEYLDKTKDITNDYMKSNPLRAVQEVWAISQTRIEDMLRYIHNKGIKIVVIAATDDTMFPMEGMQKNVKSVGVPGGFVDGFLSVRGGHMQIQVHPELYMKAAASMLEKSKQEE